MRRWLGLSLLAATAVVAQNPVPPLTARVTDLTGTLTAPQVNALEQKLAAFEARKGAQVAVLMVATTRPEAIEQFALRVVDAWKLGRGDVDDGALLLVARDDRALRIEVGYGLEGALTDATSRRIIDEVIIPYFRRGDFYGGIDAGVTRMLGVIEGEPLPEPRPGVRPDGSAGQDAFEALAPVLPVIFIFTVTIGAVLKRFLGQLPGALTTGGVAGAIAWVFIGVASVALLAAVAAFVLTLLSRAGPGRWSSGRGGGQGGGGMSSGGGFRGGGGGFGGGGASGRW